MNMQAWRTALFGPGPKKSMPILSFPSISLLGVTVRELIADPALQARGMELVARRCPTSAAVSMMDLSVEAEAFGSQISVSDDEVPSVVGAVVNSPQDAEKLAVPAVTAARTGLYVTAMADAVKRITDRPVFAGVIGPFSLAGRLMDMTEIMINCYDEPEMVHAVLGKAASFITEYIRAYRSAGANGVVMAEPAAGLLSPELCDEFSSRYVRRIAQAVREQDFLFIYHNCGNTAPLLPSIMGIGADAYHFGNAIDMLDVLKAVRDDVLVMGNIDPAGLFRLGTPEAMREAVRELLARCGGYANFAISSGCDIPPQTPWANIDAYFKAIGEFRA